MTIKLVMPTEYSDLLIQKYELIRAKLSDSVDEIWLFGSCARGEANYSSDIDILLLTSQPTRTIGMQVELLDIRDDVGPIKVDVVIRDTKAFKECMDLFSVTVRKEAILLWKK